MPNEEIKKKILDFLAENKLTVISTVDSQTNKPEAAVIAFAEKENLEIIFGTSNTSRKYKNIQTNQNVSFVIGWDGRFGTIQYEGVAEELSKEASVSHFSALGIKNPRSLKFIEREDQRYFSVKPTWIRFTDMTKNPEETHEISF